MTASKVHSIAAVAAFSLALGASVAALAQTTPAVGGASFDFGAELGAAQEVRGANVTGPFTPATLPSTATGIGHVVFERDLTSAHVDLSVQSLQFPVADAHIHCGKAGQNGPVLVPLAPTIGGNSGDIVAKDIVNEDIDNAAANGECVTACNFPLTNIAALRAAASDGCLYLNVHTDSPDTLAGEIRGQLLTNPPETTPTAPGNGGTAGGGATGGTAGGGTAGGGATGGGTTGGTTGGGTTGGTTTGGTTGGTTPAGG